MDVSGEALVAGLAGRDGDLEWWPIQRRCQVFAKLAKMPVIVRQTEG